MSTVADLEKNNELSVRTLSPVYRTDVSVWQSLTALMKCQDTVTCVQDGVSAALHLSQHDNLVEKQKTFRFVSNFTFSAVLVFISVTCCDSHPATMPESHQECADVRMPVVT